jgi:hypothetical protein
MRGKRWNFLFQREREQGDSLTERRVRRSEKERRPRVLVSECAIYRLLKHPELTLTSLFVNVGANIDIGMNTPE